MRLPRLRAETVPLKQVTLCQALRRADTHLSGVRNDRMGNGFHSLNRIGGVILRRAETEGCMGEGFSGKHEANDRKGTDERLTDHRDNNE
jgi:hypothetical protein